MHPVRTITRESITDLRTDLEKAGVAYESTAIEHAGAGMGETLKIIYTSPKTGKKVYVKAVYSMVASDGIVETLEYYDADFELSVTQDQAHAVGNAHSLNDTRLTDWERQFVANLMDNRLLDDVSRLTDKQQASLATIFNKIAGGIDGWTAPNIYRPASTN